jgi:RecA-family ATPase
MIVLDTLSRVIAGGNENAPDDMGQLIGNCDRIRAEARAHVMLVHHTGKDEARGARGHSSLRAATDTEIEVSGGNGVSLAKDLVRCG